MMTHYGYTVASVKTLLCIKCVSFLDCGKKLPVMFDNTSTVLVCRINDVQYCLYYLPVEQSTFVKYLHNLTF